jgi:hypothetical protein
MLVTLEGIVTLVSPEQSENAEAPMLVTLEGIMILPCIPPGPWIRIVWFLSNKTPPRLLYAIFDDATVILVRPEQP